jgi:hypothetical protein
MYKFSNILFPLADHNTQLSNYIVPNGDNSSNDIVTSEHSKWSKKFSR